MRASSTLTVLSFLLMTWACHPKESKEKTAEIEPAVKEVVESADDTTELPAPKIKKASLDLYPPIYTVYPLSRPEPSHAFFFGYAADAERPFQTVLAYVVAVEPDFQYGETAPPVLLDSQAYDSFMIDWALQFQKRPELVQKLKDLAANFSWQIDSQYIDDKAELIPDRVLDDQPRYARITQITLARRLTFKMAGSTEVKGDTPSGIISIPMNIKAYSKAQIDLGKARYEKVGAACISCHAGPEAVRSAFLKHSSDFMAYFTDSQIVGFMKNSSNPDGSDFLEGLHVNAFVDVAEEEGMVAFLRNMLPWYDKALQPAF